MSMSKRSTHVPAMITNSARGIIKRVFAPSTTPLLPFVTKWTKVLFLLLVLLNSSSFPFMWHIRVWYTPLRAYYLAYRQGARKFWANWRKDYDRLGGLKDMRVRVWRRALFDDCDYNMHLSNSCYAKNSDAAKMEYAIAAFAPCFRTGMHMALGASHWKYIKEIPLGSRYLMETRIGGWGDKWIHVVTEFVIYPLKKKESAKKVEPKESCEEEHLIPNLSDPPSGTATPDSGPQLPPKTPEEVIRRLAAQARVRQDDGVVACIAVTDYCFKQGRITIPPRIAMFLSLLSPDEEQRNFARSLLESKDRGASFARGGWRDHPDADKFGCDVGLDINGSQAWADEGRNAMEAAGAHLNHF